MATRNSSKQSCPPPTRLLGLPYIYTTCSLFRAERLAVSSNPISDIPGASGPRSIPHFTHQRSSHESHWSTRGWQQQEQHILNYRSLSRHGETSIAVGGADQRLLRLRALRRETRLDRCWAGAMTSVIPGGWIGSKHGDRSRTEATSGCGGVGWTFDGGPLGHDDWWRRGPGIAPSSPQTAELTGCVWGHCESSPGSVSLGRLLEIHIFRASGAGAPLHGRRRRWSFIRGSEIGRVVSRGWMSRTLVTKC